MNELTQSSAPSFGENKGDDQTLDQDRAHKEFVHTDVWLYMRGLKMHSVKKIVDILSYFEENQCLSMTPARKWQLKTATSIYMLFWRPTLKYETCVHKSRCDSSAGSIRRWSSISQRRRKRREERENQNEIWIEKAGRTNRQATGIVICWVSKRFQLAQDKAREKKWAGQIQRHAQTDEKNRIHWWRILKWEDESMTFTYSIVERGMIEASSKGLCRGR